MDIDMSRYYDVTSLAESHRQDSVAILLTCKWCVAVGVWAKQLTRLSVQTSAQLK